MALPHKLHPHLDAQQVRQHEDLLVSQCLPSPPADALAAFVLPPRPGVPDWRLPIFLLRRWLAIAVLVGGVLVTVGVAHRFHSDARRTARDRFGLLQREMTDDVRNRLAFYGKALRGAASLFDTMANVSRDEWRTYVNGLLIDQSYPGIQGLGYAVHLHGLEGEAPTQSDDRSAFSGVRAVVYPEFSVFPRGARPEFAAVINFEPLKAGDPPASGFDLFSDPMCREAMLRARDTGETAMTGQVPLVAPAGPSARTGFFIFLPAYRHEMAHDTPERRQKAIAGYFYAPFRATEFVAGISRDATAGIATELFDGDQPRPENLIYESVKTTRSPSRYTAEFQETTAVNVFGHRWSMRLSSLPAFDASIDDSIWRWVLGVGLLSSALLFTILLELSLTRQRARDLAEHMSAAVRASEASVRETTSAMKVARDVAIEASRAKTDFLATMSHEIRTPLNGVLGISELLLDTPLSDDQRQHVQTLKHCGETLLRLVNDVLDLSKIEAGKMEIARVPFELRSTLRAALSVSKARAKQKSLRMTGAVDDNVPDHLLGDPQRVEQVVLNLVSNAVKFTEGGSVSVRIHRQEAGPTPLILIEVIDTGPGISLAAQGRLFEPFLQVDRSSTRKHGGTGLGLAICKRLVKAMGGNIGVDSTPGQGSRFWFTARFEEAHGPQRVTPVSDAAGVGEADEAPVTRAPPSPGIETGAAGTEAPAGALAPPRILLAEDNPVNQTVAMAMLRKYEATIDLVVNGQQAFEASRQHQYSLIFMDCQMPEIDGFEATALIRQAEARGGSASRVTIVALTANALAEDRERCLAGGMDDYLSKPVSRAALDTALKRWLPHIAAAPAGVTAATAASPAS